MMMLIDVHTWSIDNIISTYRHKDWTCDERRRFCSCKMLHLTSFAIDANAFHIPHDRHTTIPYNIMGSHPNYGHNKKNGSP